MTDLISRSELKKVLKRWAEIYRDDITVNAFVGLGVAAVELRKAPAIDAVPVVHARWIHDINNLYGCSECMARETMSHKKLKKFCPNCGARMDAEEKPDAD